ncbi:hypothetical protein CCY99_00135 [Helicobacter sp. 16-1353]|uniref:hypothetical protein n=1 Tax=Helicobacter sp. 16-1353 TaxID=2004996 RepID=UPI000DCE9E2A|nr:hypothetical protein [Helicobacter sp. 16-1353]RAX55143.1 hypothetical protein CCY99_00135 [Helicobacter sp. 16-1353]
MVNLNHNPQNLADSKTSHDSATPQNPSYIENLDSQTTQNLNSQIPQDSQNLQNLQNPQNL